MFKAEVMESFFNRAVLLQAFADYSPRSLLFNHLNKLNERLKFNNSRSANSSVGFFAARNSFNCFRRFHAVLNVLTIAALFLICEFKHAKRILFIPARIPPAVDVVIETYLQRQKKKTNFN